MRYRALRTIMGDYGLVHEGGVFEVPDSAVRGMAKLVAKGAITPDNPVPPGRKMYTVYENKMLKPSANKESR